MASNGRRTWTQFTNSKVRVDLFTSDVFKKLNAQKRRALIRISFFGRRVMKRSMRVMKGKKRGTPSTPPRPPHAQIGTLRTFIFGGYDAVHDASIVGPELLPGKSRNPPLPQLLNEGGTITRQVKQFRKRRKGVQKQAVQTVAKQYTYRARPYGYGSPNYKATVAAFPKILVDSGFN